VNGKVSAATQTQALSALLFLYREVLGMDLPWMDGLVRAKPSKRIPNVLSVGQVHRLMSELVPKHAASHNTISITKSGYPENPARGRGGRVTV
jgi:site-specific recombinase XerD